MVVVTICYDAMREEWGVTNSGEWMKVKGERRQTQTDANKKLGRRSESCEVVEGEEMKPLSTNASMYEDAY